MCRACNQPPTDWAIEDKTFDRQPLTEDFVRAQMKEFERGYNGWENLRDFKRWLRYRITGDNPTDRTRQVQTVGLCASCNSFTLNYETLQMGWGGMNTICTRTCIKNYVQCSECERYGGQGMVNKNGKRYCDTCASNLWARCTHCGDAYDHGTEHHCRNACCPPIPKDAKTFTLGGVANDTMTTVEVEANQIPDSAITRIWEKIRDWAYMAHVYGGTRGYPMPSITEEEKRKYYTLANQLRDGEVEEVWRAARGLYPTRVKSYAYKTHGLRLSKDLLTSIGNLASDGIKGGTFRVEFTRKLDMSAKDFGNASSCWWTYPAYRCNLKTKGGLAMRSFNERGEVSGRVWVSPLKKRETNAKGFNEKAEWATDIGSADAFLVFNAYGAISDHNGPRVLAQLLGWKYKKVIFRTNMYTNGDGAYIVAPDPDQFITGATRPEFHLQIVEHQNFYQAVAAV